MLKVSDWMPTFFLLTVVASPVSKFRNEKELVTNPAIGG